ncbi:putative uncharacterized protein [Bacteroides sp. CAG:1076]|jgi:hypothetical protein|nr:putative uncharacterized protein [Bacteroides sp. CAG:1076]
MKLLKNFIFIALMGTMMGACDWYSDPLELVYPGTDLSGNKEDNKESELIKDVEQVLTTSSDEVWKITKEDIAVYLFFNVEEGKYQMKSTVNPRLVSYEYKMAVNEDEQVEISFVGSDLKSVLGDETFVISSAKVSSITCKGKESNSEYMWKRAPRKEMDAIMTEEEKIDYLLASVEEGGGWKISLSGNTCYFIFDTEQKTVITKSERAPQNVSGTYSLSQNSEGQVELTLVQSHFEELAQENVLVIMSTDENTITCKGKSNGISYTMTKASKAELDNIKSPEVRLIEKMFELGWGSGVIRSASNGDFVAYYYVTKNDHTVHFLSYANQKVSRVNAVLTVTEEGVLSFQSPVGVGNESLQAIKVGDEAVELTGLGASNKLTANVSYGKDKTSLYKMADWIKLPGGSQPQFKNVRCVMSSNLQDEYNKIPGFDNVPIFEWNGDWSSIVIYVDNYYFMLYQGGNMTPVEGTDIIRFNKDAGLAAGYGSDINVVKSYCPNIYTFLFDEDHIIVRSNDTPEAGLYVFSIVSDTFIYWPQPVFQ